MNALQFEAVKVAFKQDRTGFVLTLNIHPDELPSELMRDFVGTRYGVAMVRINDDETPVTYDNRVKKSGILCRSRGFQYYVNQLGESEDITEESAVEYIHRTCGIKSRSELNGNENAKKLFDEMVKAYEHWDSEGDPF